MISQNTIPFSPPRVDQKTIDAVTEVLKSGWITTGPKTRELEEKINQYCGSKRTLCLNAWTNAAELVLRWYGVGPGDEVIVPAYTYAATANIVIHVGATPVMVDVKDYNIDVDAINKAITPRTKVIMPVDIAGLPCDYDTIMQMVNSPAVKDVFNPQHENQIKLGRILVLNDAAHSFGASYKNHKVGNQCDVVGFSFHAVKNLTTAEGGAITLNLPEPFDNSEIWTALNRSALHGQTKDALSKTKAGQWRYDIVEPGYKCNMTDLQAAIGLVELARYDNDTLVRRKAICERYSAAFANSSHFKVPVFVDEMRISCYHLYMLRIVGANEDQRDAIIQFVADRGISTNVHFQPLPLLSYYKGLGYKMSDYPEAWACYENEISLPVYYDLTDAQVDIVIQCLLDACQEIMK
jgi:dTDP-4-amino-4,6-dideoxygalactose transaminase